MNPLWLLALLLGLGGMALLAWSIKALDAAGAATAFGMGLVIVLATDVGWLVLLVSFTAVSVLATKVGQAKKEQKKAAEARGGERGLKNVLANGLAAMFMVLFIRWTGELAAALAFASAVAAVTADTMASEIGALSRRARRIVPPFEAIRAGQNGGVSWLGQFAGAAGACLIAILAVALVGLPGELAWVPAVAGFLGCQMDSILGALWERNGTEQEPGRPLTKEDVNFLASLAPAVIVLIAYAGA